MNYSSVLEVFNYKLQIANYKFSPYATAAEAPNCGA
jgi:hypothetical protein